MKKLSLLLALLTAGATVLTACGGGDNANTPADTTANAAGDNSDTAETTAEPEYVLPSYDFKGENFHIMHTDTQNWGFSCGILAEEENGDILNDTRYAINTQVEEHFNLKLTSEPVWIRDIAAKMLNTVLAGDDVYNYGILPCSAMNNIELFNALYELTQFDEIHADAEWWDASVSKAQSYVTGDDRYFLAGNVSLITAEDTMCLFFNEDMVKNLGLEMLYDVVRRGEWTLDKLIEYCTAAANLNGDDSFAFNATEGNAIYGMSTWATGARAILTGMDNPFTALDSSTGKPVMNLENDHFYSAVEKAAKFHATEGLVLNTNSGGSGAPTHYETVLKNGRSMFTCAQLKAAATYRDMEATFGVVPLPKFDAKQENYYSHCTTNTQVHCIPVTIKEAEATAAVMDAMAYLAQTELMPAFYNINMEQKQLRNEDSIEMLNIILSNRAFDIGTGFGWFSSFSTAVQNAILAGDTGIASIVASNKEAIESSIQKTLDALAK